MVIMSHRPLLGMVVAGLALVGLLLLPLQATAAMKCSEWRRVDPGNQHAVIEQLIHSELYANKYRKYQINRAALERCLSRHIRAMAGDFDYACSQGSRASMSVLQEVFNGYLDRCI